MPSRLALSLAATVVLGVALGTMAAYSSLGVGHDLNGTTRGSRSTRSRDSAYFVIRRTPPSLPPSPQELEEELNAHVAAHAASDTVGEAATANDGGASASGSPSRSSAPVVVVEVNPPPSSTPRLDSGVTPAQSTSSPPVIVLNLDPSPSPTPRVDPSTTPSTSSPPTIVLDPNPSPEGSPSPTPRVDPAQSTCPPDAVVCVPPPLWRPARTVSRLCRLDDNSRLPTAASTLTSDGRLAVDFPTTGVFDNAAIVMWRGLVPSPSPTPPSQPSFVTVPTPSDGPGTVPTVRRRLETPAAPTAALCVAVPQGRAAHNGVVFSKHHLFSSSWSRPEPQLHLPPHTTAMGGVGIKRVQRGVVLGIPHGGMLAVVAWLLPRLEMVLDVVAADPTIALLLPSTGHDQSTVVNWLSAVLGGPSAATRVIPMMPGFVVVASDFLLVPDWHVPGGYHGGYLPPQDALPAAAAFLQHCPLFTAPGVVVGHPEPLYSGDVCAAEGIARILATLRSSSPWPWPWLAPSPTPSPSSAVDIVLGVPGRRRRLRETPEEVLVAWAHAQGERPTSVVWVAPPPGKPGSVLNGAAVQKQLRERLPPPYTLDVVVDDLQHTTGGHGGWGFALQAAFRTAAVVVSPLSPGLAGVVFAAGEAAPAVVYLGVSPVQGREVPAVHDCRSVEAHEEDRRDPVVGVAAAVAAGAQVLVVPPVAGTPTAMQVDGDAVVEAVLGVL